MAETFRMRDHVVSCVGLLLILLAGLLYYPGRYFLTSDTQIYTVMMEHQLHPQFLAEDLLAQYPHLAFSLYDEMVNGVRAITGLSYEAVMVSFQVFFRCLMLGAAYLFAFVLCRSRLIALWVAASLQIVSLVAGPVVCVFEWEPVPRGFSLALEFLAVVLVMAKRPWIAAWTVAFAVFFQAGVIYPFLICFAGWLAFARGNEPFRRRILLLLPTVLLTGIVIAVAFARPDGQDGAGSLFATVEAWHLDVIRIRASYNLISTWPTSLIVQSLLAPVLIASSYIRLRDVVSKDKAWFLIGIPVIALLSVPGSWIAMEKLRLFGAAQLQPARAMAFGYAMAVVMLLSAGVLAARKQKWLESAFWISSGYAVVFLDQITATIHSLPLFPELRSHGFWAIGLGILAAIVIRFRLRYPLPAAIALFLLMAAPFAIYRLVFDINYFEQDARNPDVLALSSWAADSTDKDAIFHFAGFGKNYQPGVFRATARRAVYVDWKAGGQVNFNTAFARIWWDRWQNTGNGRFRKEQLPYLSSLDLDYLVLEPKSALQGVDPIYRNPRFLVYRVEDIPGADTNIPQPSP